MAQQILKGFTRVVQGWNAFWNLWSNNGPAYQSNYTAVKNATSDIRKS